MPALQQVYKKMEITEGGIQTQEDVPADSCYLTKTLSILGSDQINYMHYLTWRDHIHSKL